MAPQAHLHQTPPHEVFFEREEKRARLRLIRSENVGCITFYDLIRRHGSAQEALLHLNTYAEKGGRTKPLKVFSNEAAHQEIEQTTNFGATYLFQGEASYPQALNQIYDPPPVLIIKGHSELLQKRCFAIVGARNASLAGQKMARQLAADLGKQGFVIVSGAARGIDRAAHEGALQHGTIGCIAGGIDHVYPPENQDLFEKITAQGVLLTESPFATTPHASFFPRRNRLISGLSLGVLIVEAALKSGSLITARTALEQNRDVFAIPGSPLDPRSHGPNRLIQQGAKLVQKVEDILDYLPLFSTNNTLDLPEPNSPQINALEEDLPPKEWEQLRQKILDLLSPTPILVDELLRECHFSYAVISYVLLELELAGRLMRHVGNRVSLVPAT